MSRWSIFWYFTGNFWSKRRKSRWRSVRQPYLISDKKLSGFRILVQRPSNTPKIIKIGQPCLWTCLHGFLVDMLLIPKRCHFLAINSNKALLVCRFTLYCRLSYITSNFKVILLTSKVISLEVSRWNQFIPGWYHCLIMNSKFKTAPHTLWEHS